MFWTDGDLSDPYPRPVGAGVAQEREWRQVQERQDKEWREKILEESSFEHLEGWATQG